MKNKNLKNGMWTEKYRAKDFGEMIASDHIRNLGQRIIDTGQFQNLLLYGSFGIGKTTFAEIIIDKLNLNSRVPRSRHQQVIRDLYKLSSSTTVLGERYVAYIDEADQLLNASQKELLRFMEGYGTMINSSILLANDIEKIHKGVRSRTTEVCFDWRGKDMKFNLVQLRSRITFILENEAIGYHEKDLEGYIEKYFIDKWDIRKLVNELQGGVSVDGELMGV